MLESFESKDKISLLPKNSILILFSLYYYMDSKSLNSDIENTNEMVELDETADNTDTLEETENNTDNQDETDNISIDNSLSFITFALLINIVKSLDGFCSLTNISFCGAEKIT